MLAAVCYRSLTWKGLWTAMVETGKLAVMIYFIIAASLTFSQILSFSGATTGLLSLIQQVDPTPFSLLVAMMGLISRLPDGGPRLGHLAAPADGRVGGGLAPPGGAT